MKIALTTKLLTVLLVCGSYSNLAYSQVNDSKAKADTPLLDRELFFGNPRIAGGQLSPDGKFISFMKPYQGIMNVWVKEFAEPFDKTILK